METISTGKAFNELDSKELGQMGERVATNYIEKMGLTVVDINYQNPFRRNRHHLLSSDLVYHFIEIKARRGMQHGLAREGSYQEKQSILNGAAMLFLYDLNQKRRWKEISFDVMGVYLHEDFQSSIHYLPQCF